MSVAPRPRARVLVACAAAIAVAAVPVGLAGPAAAAGESLTAVTLGTSAVTVEGFGSADVAISVDMTLASPARGCTGQEARLAGRPWVRLTRTSGATGIRVDDVVDVPLVTPPAGDPAATAGTWSGTWKVASSRNGTWTVTGVGACTDAVPGGWFVDPRGQGISSGVAVTGTGAPRLSVAMTPTVWGARTTTVRAVVSDASGKPLTGRTVTFGKDGGCGTAADGGAVATTDARGVATLVTRPRPVMCAYLATPAAVALRLDSEHALIVKRSVTPRFTFAAVSGFPLSAAVARGRNVVVTGSLAPKASLLGAGTTHRVALQLKSGRGWRTVGSAAVAASGRFTVIARATVRGIVTYRVLATANRAMVPTAGRPLLVVVY